MTLCTKIHSVTNGEQVEDVELHGINVVRAECGELQEMFDARAECDGLQEIFDARAECGALQEIFDEQIARSRDFKKYLDHEQKCRQSFKRCTS